MSDEKVLTKEIAEQILVYISVESNEFTAIEDDAAETLSKHEGYLSLDGLTSLSDGASYARYLYSRQYVRSKHCGSEA